MGGGGSLIYTESKNSGTLGSAGTNSISFTVDFPVGSKIIFTGTGQASGNGTIGFSAGSITFNGATYHGKTTKYTQGSTNPSTDISVSSFNLGESEIANTVGITGLFSFCTQIIKVSDSRYVLQGYAKYNGSYSISFFKECSGVAIISGKTDITVNASATSGTDNWMPGPCVITSD